MEYADNGYFLPNPFNKIKVIFHALSFQSNAL